MASSTSQWDALLQSEVLAKKSTPPLALKVQVLSAEFCAALSYAMLPSSSPATKKVVPSLAEAKLPQVLAETALLHPLWEDLAAHYGNAAVARGAAKPLGPSFRGYQAQKEGRHSGRARRIWRTQAVRRAWCVQCGVPRIAGRTTEVVTVRPVCKGKGVDQKSKKEVVCNRCLRRALPVACEDTTPQPDQRSVLLPPTIVRACALKRHRRKRTHAKAGKKGNSANSSNMSRVANAVAAGQKQQITSKSSLLATIPKVSARSSAATKAKPHDRGTTEKAKEPVSAPSKLVAPAPQNDSAHPAFSPPPTAKPQETALPPSTDGEGSQKKAASTSLLSIPSITRKPNKDKSGKSSGGGGGGNGADVKRGTSSKDNKKGFFDVMSSLGI